MRWSWLVVAGCLWLGSAAARADTTTVEVEKKLATGEYEAADKLLESAPHDAPHDALRLALLFARGRYDDVIAQSKQARSAGMLRLRARALAARGRLEEAIAVLEKSDESRGAFPTMALLGELHGLRGERSESERAYYRLIEAFNDGRIHKEDAAGLCAVAQAARALGATKDANRSFAEAARAAPDDMEIERAWAELFLDKEDVQNAERSIAKILDKNPRDAPALERLARIRLAQGASFEAIEKLLQEALAIQPSLVSAHVSLAGLALRDMELKSADEHLEEALKVNPRDLEALSVRAAVRLLSDDRAGFERAVAAVLKENPRFSRTYSIIATYADWEHRYEELVKLADRALKIDPQDAYAHATRGLNLLRVGREKEGREALERSWALDRYNVRVFNTLNLYDDIIDKEYVTVESAPFRVRLHRDDQRALEGPVSSLLGRAYADMKTRYGMTPKGPLSIELYANQDHFSVRTSGLPRLGVQGVCFGKVVTALSPSADEINWGQVVWHELSHVFHVQLSDSHVPRWFTEGLAEWETMRARPEWKREDDRSLYDALREGSLPALSEMNEAFTHARTASALMVAYYASSQVVTFIVERHGFAKVARMLSLWGAGKSTDEVFKTALGEDVASIDAAFRTTTQARLETKYAHDFRVEAEAFADLDARRATAQKKGASAHEHAALAMALAVAHKHQEALAQASAVLEQAPTEPLALFTRAHVALIDQKPVDAERALRALLNAGHQSYQAHMLLARLLMTRKDNEKALVEAEAATRVDAERPEAYDLMIRIARALGNETKLTWALKRYVAIDQHSRAPIRDLLPRLLRAGDMDGLLAASESALYVDPKWPELARLYGEALLAKGRAGEAVKQASTAEALAESPPQKAQAAWLVARAEHAQSHREAAKSAADRAVALDPALREQANALLSR